MTEYLADQRDRHVLAQKVASCVMSKVMPCHTWKLTLNRRHWRLVDLPDRIVSVICQMVSHRIEKCHGCSYVADTI